MNNIQIFKRASVALQGYNAITVNYYFFVTFLKNILKQSVLNSNLFHFVLNLNYTENYIIWMYNDVNNDIYNR